MTLAGRFELALAPALGAALLAPAAAAAQQGPPTPPVDSTEIRVRERLVRLNKPPGVDSTLIRLDSVVNRRRENPRPAAADSFMSFLLQREGYAVTNYDGTGAHFDAGSSRLMLMGDGGDKPATLTRPDMRLTAVDTITMDDPRSLVWTRGATVTERPGEEPVNSENIIYDLSDGRGSAFGARTRFNQGAEWILEGDLPSVMPDTIFGHEIMFTSCQEEKPHYHFAAREMKAIGGGWMVARNVTLNFGDVPVFWLPFIFQNVESERSSGILFPRFSMNDVVRTSRGQSRRISNVGFYWAVNDYADATVALDWWSDNFLSLTGDVRYNVLRRFLNGSLTYRQFWESDGGRQLSFNTQHNWEVSERTSFRAAASFVSSASFVLRNSFDTQESTRAITSDGGLNRRFDWGTLSLTANRQQFLSDDRVEMTLPSANLSLKTITLFKAPPNEGSFYSNLTWSGTAGASRRTVNRADQDPAEAFSIGQADQATTDGSFSSTFTLGSFSWNQRMQATETVQSDIPHEVAFPEDTLAGDPLALTDLSATNLTWSTSLNYQQRLIGSTTLTPSVSINGSAKRDDRIEEAQSFVSGPTRVEFGARLKSDVYGFFGGFGPFEAIRHKISPSFDYRYAPEVNPTELQGTVFGARDAKAKNILSIGLNQTFEAKRRAPPDSARAEAEGAPGQAGEGDAAPDSLAAPVDSAGVADEQGLRRRDQSAVVNLLSISTSAVTYDFVEAAEEGRSFLDGFQTTQVTNNLTSDFLRGLQVTMVHALFDTDEGGERTFSPFLTRLNLGFSVSNSSGIVRALGSLLGRGGPPGAGPRPEADAEEDEALEEDLDLLSSTDEATMVPGRSPTRRDPNRPRTRRSVGGWNANLSYSLSRTRLGDRPADQLLQGTLRFRPTENWDMSWRTSYDITDGSFSDHVIRLSRDLHRWRADFDFLQTPTGNWTFRFNVSLTDNRDIKFDYEQRNNVRGESNRF